MRPKPRLDIGRRSGSYTPPQEIVGGLVVGAEGEGGTIYEGYTLSWGDDFTSLNVIRPSNSRGRYFTTRTYLAGARGSDTLLSTMQDVDPYWTGHNDSNRGEAVGYDNMSQSGSELALQARRATAAEDDHFEGSGRAQVSAMICGAGAVGYYPSTADTGDIIVEMRLKYSAKAGNPAGWHPTFWSKSTAPTPSTTGDETDFEGNSQGGYFNRNTWTDGSFTTDSDPAGVVDTYDGSYHTYSFKLNKTGRYMFLDGVASRELVTDANSKNRPQSFVLSNHIYNGTFFSEAYSAAAWAADADGATVTIDWVRVWRRTGNSHFRPLVTLDDTNVDYNASTVITLPGKATIWGDGTVTEYLEAVMTEENEPGGSHTVNYVQFPTGVSYDATPRELTVNITSGKTGRINFVLHGYKTDGSTYEPLRFSVNVGPRFTGSNPTSTEDVEISPIDMYAFWDCGVLVSDSNGAKAKTISVTGLPDGLSYSDATGLITGTPTTVGSYPYSTTCTNSVGQQATQNLTYTVSAAGASDPAYESWTGPGWFDASALSESDGAALTSWTNLRTGDGDLTKGGTAAITVAAAAQNGLKAVRVTRDVASSAAVAWMRALSTSALSQTFQGDDKPWTVIAAYKPTDTNTGFIWTASDTIDGTDAQTMGLVRRNATASSVRRQLTAAGGANDISWGSGQASGTPRVVAIKHTGTAVTVWDNSTTKAVDGTAQNTATFNSELLFYLFATEGAGGDPTFLTVACALDFYEVVVEDSAKADADITQAIEDIADKWGITLS